MVRSACGRIMRSVRRRAGSSQRGGGGFILPVVDAEKAAANNLRGIGALHRGQAHHRRGELPQHVNGLIAGPCDAGKRDPQRQGVVEIGKVIENDQHHNQRQ